MSIVAIKVTQNGNLVGDYNIGKEWFRHYKLVQSYNIGDIADGVVSNIFNKTVFICLNNDISGILSLEYLENKEATMWKIGDRVKVKVDKVLQHQLLVKIIDSTINI